MALDALEPYYGNIKARETVTESAKMAKRIGRPPMKGPKRDVALRVLVTKAEADAIKAKAKAAGFTLSDYMRRLALESERT